MISSRDFQRIARQKLTTAEFLLMSDYTLDAIYLGGYTIECTLKALIMHLTIDGDKAARFAEISQGTRGHNLEFLAGLLKDEFAIKIPPELTSRFRRSQWSVNLRYQLGRWDAGETRGFLKLAKATYDWVEKQLP